MKNKHWKKYIPYFKVFQKASFLLYEKFIKPKSKNDDSRRREFILTILLLASVVFSLILIFIIIYQSINQGLYYKGFAASDMSLVFFGFIILYLLSRAGLFALVSYVFIAVFFILTTYTIYQWGADVPMALLSYALIIVMVGVLIGTRFASGITITTVLIILAVTYFQLSGIIHPKLYWKPETLKLKDSIQFSAILLVIAVVSWLSNREIERSLSRARKSEAELKEERDMLEVRVKERTKELEKTQREKMNQATRFVEFGKISSGLFHDLVNRLNFLFLNIEQAAEANGEELAKLKRYVKQADETKRALSEYIDATRKQFQNQETDAWFLMKDEILCVINILNYRLTKENVRVKLETDFNATTYGHPVKFTRVITNILLNSLDAYKTIESNERKEICIKLGRIKENAVISIKDWAGGVSKEIQSRIFEPFFTTKGSQKGTGIGLSTVKDIIEDDFGGTIFFQSVPGQGTEFIIEFPIRNETNEL